MGKLAILLVFVAMSPALAQDDGGAALFYKGFWLEQAEGKLDEAAALYGKLLRELPDAPEAPRALLGLVRIKVAKGEDALELVAELERRYPAAKDEIASARKVAVRVEFDFEARQGDSPVLAKLKELYAEGTGFWTEADRLFLVDLGSAAHPMLARLLRSTSDARVQKAVDVLVAQRTPEAYAVLAAALLDETALFRSTIVASLAGRPNVPLTVMDALAKLYDSSAPRLREQVVHTLGTLASGERRDHAFEILTRALADRDEAVRAAALVGIANAEATDAYVDAALKAVETGGGSEPSYVAPYLLRFADRAAFRERIERIVEARSLQADVLPRPLPDEGAVLLAEVLIRRSEGGKPVDTHVVARAAQSPRTAAMLLMAAVKTRDRHLVDFHRDNAEVQRDLGPEADRIRTEAIAAAGGLDDATSLDSEILGIVGVEEADYPSIREGLRRRGDRGFPVALLKREWLRALGPAKAGALVEFCRSERDVRELLRAGTDFARREDVGVEFFRQVVPKAGLSSAAELRGLAEFDPLRDLVADRLLAADDPTWGWGAGLKKGQGGWYQLGTRAMDGGAAGREYPGPYLWLHVAASQLREGRRGKLLEHVMDKRPEIAATAAAAARDEKTDAGTAALKRALGSTVAGARETALEALVERVPDGPAVVREFARGADLAPEDRAAVAFVLHGGPQYAPVAAELLRTGTWPELWPVYQEIAPKECVDLALAEAAGDTKGDHRLGAVQVLAQVEDPRRIEVFRKVLAGSDRSAINAVLIAVRDQYLVELGEEALAQLRNPDPGIRHVATQAIDNLKFYADAKKAFEK